MKETKFKNYDLYIKDFFKGYLFHFNYNDSIGYLDKFYQNDKNSFYQNPLFQLSLVFIDPNDYTFDSFIINQDMYVEKNSQHYSCKSYFEEFNHNMTILTLRSQNLSDYKQFYYNISDYNYENFQDLKLKINPNSIIFFTILPNQSFISLFQKENFTFTDMILTYSLFDNFIDLDSKDFFEKFEISEQISLKENVNQNFKIEFERHQYIFQLIDLIDDFGFIFNEKTNKSKIKKASEIKSSDPYLPYIFAISFDKAKKIYERRYKKLQNILADLGGLINFFIIAGKIIIYAFNENKFYYELSNRVFKFEYLEIFDNKNKQTNNIIENINFKASLNKDQKVNRDQNFSSRTIGPLDNSKMILRSEKNQQIKNIGKIQLKYDIISNKDLTQMRNKNFLEFSDISIKKLENNNQDNKSKIELPLYDENKLTRVDINKMELIDDESLIKNKIHQFIKINNKKKKIIKFSRCEFFKMILCLNNFKNREILKKQEIFENLKDKIKHYMNVVNYCSLFENFEKLKMIILNPIQNFCFNFLKTPKFDKSENDNFEIEMRNVYKYFNTNKERSKVIDNRFIDNFSFDFIKFLN